MLRIKRLLCRRSTRHALRTALAARQLRSRAQAQTDDQAHRLWSATRRTSKLLKRLRNAASEGIIETQDLVHQVERLVAFDHQAEQLIQGLRAFQLHGTDTLGKALDQACVAKEYLGYAANELEFRSVLLEIDHALKHLADQSASLLEDSERYLRVGPENIQQNERSKHL